MSGILSFHHLAAARGDGLHPLLRQVLEERERLAASGATVVELAGERGLMVQAGPNPSRALPPFLPGNVVRFEPAAADTSRASRKSSAI